MVPTVESLTHLIEPLLEAAQFELVELRIKGVRQCPHFQIFIDHEQGITIDDCSRLSGVIGAAIDQAYPDLPNYRLEVSSPGIDRPLKTVRDFQRHLGRQVHVVFSVETAREEIEGKIASVSEDMVTIETRTGPKRVPITAILEAKQILTW